MDHWHPVVGERVTLTREGVRKLFGSTHGLAYMTTLELTITWVGEPFQDEGGELTVPVNVDAEDINRFMLTSLMFRPKHQPLVPDTRWQSPGVAYG